MQNNKYTRQYFLPPEFHSEWVRKDHIEKAPVWCSVDLWEGNQALIEPMSLEEKLEYFRMLVKIGFKEIEVGFPAESDTEYKFLRTLIQQNMIPKDVTVQVLTNADAYSIRKTFEAVKGVPRAIIHIYNSLSTAVREQIFRKNKEEMKKNAVEGASFLKQLAAQTKGNFIFEYSPEGFTGTEPEYALEVCNAVLDEWQPDKAHKVIINLPGTVQFAMSHVFANQVEYMSKHLKYRDHVILSLRPHNDRGTGVSDAELGILAGADRIEGTLFGNGERTGNVDIVTLAMNMFTHGVDPKLDFKDIQKIRESYERLTDMNVPERQPYAGNLVFSAFSQFHREVIAKGLEYREKNDMDPWNVPYLPIDPGDVGRKYESDGIRINRQSGKSGVAYILKQEYGLALPNAMKEEVGFLMHDISEREHRELTPYQIYCIFEDKYINRDDIFRITEAHYRQLEDGILAEVTINQGGEGRVVRANGNGRLSAVSNAIKQYFDISYELTIYEEHAISRGSSSKAATFVGVSKNEKLYWGVGIHEDIITASVQALASAVNQIKDLQESASCQDQRMLEILNYIQCNYLSVSLEELSTQFYLSKPYLSKYIKEKSGSTFGEILKKVRMKKARSLLRNRSMTVESIAESVGYQNVEHFNRLFKKAYGMTPIQFRNQK